MLDPVSPALSAIVVTHLGGALLARCLEALRPQLGPDDELLVVVSNDRPVDLSACAHPAEALVLPRNLGFARAANAGLARARGTLLLVLNDDTSAQPGFLEALRAAAQRPGLYQPRILLRDGSGRLDNVGHGLYPDGFNWARGREDHDGAGYDPPGEVGACSGAALLLHRAVLEEVGGFDEDLGSFGEDVDLSLRARRRGFPLVYVPEARVEHALGASWGRYGARKVYLIERNRVRLALRSLPLGAVLTMPGWTGLRLVGLAAARAGGHGWSARVGPEAAGAALLGLAAGLAGAPAALRKRRADAPRWPRR